jgi:hypothetical protein
MVASLIPTVAAVLILLLVRNNAAAERGILRAV